MLSLATVPFILAKGAKTYADYGMGRSRGTMPIQLAGNVKHGGLFETAFGITLGELVDDIGGGTHSGRPVKAVQVGGPLGPNFPRALFDTPFDYEAFGGQGRTDRPRRHRRLRRHRRHGLPSPLRVRVLCAIESCGKCTPCRIGSTRGKETVEKIMAGIEVEKNLSPGSRPFQHDEVRLALRPRGFTPYPVMSALTHFPEDFRRGVVMEAAE